MSITTVCCFPRPKISRGLEHRETLNSFPETQATWSRDPKWVLRDSIPKMPSKTTKRCMRSRKSEEADTGHYPKLRWDFGQEASIRYSFRTEYLTTAMATVTVKVDGRPWHGLGRKWPLGSGRASSRSSCTSSINGTFLGSPPCVPPCHLPMKQAPTAPSTLRIDAHTLSTLQKQCLSCLPTQELVKWNGKKASAVICTLQALITFVLSRAQLLQERRRSASSCLHVSFHLLSNLNLPGPISASGGTSGKSLSDICIPLFLGHSFPPCPPPLARFATRPMEHTSSRQSFLPTEYLTASRSVHPRMPRHLSCAPQSVISRLPIPCLQINNLTATYRCNACTLPVSMFKSSSTNTFTPLTAHSTTESLLAIIARLTNNSGSFSTHNLHATDRPAGVSASPGTDANANPDTLVWGFTKKRSPLLDDPSRWDSTKQALMPLRGTVSASSPKLLSKGRFLSPLTSHLHIYHVPTEYMHRLRTHKPVLCMDAQRQFILGTTTKRASGDVYMLARLFQRQAVRPSVPGQLASHCAALSHDQQEPP
ncbi:uncharacterized protein CLUP02_02635 [Colletotrichum lupini]|uniref:Uncharacterized protein n=1 Tax=Colletotrichum lupini TaxID=145971 RepID=A0A9Q8WB02_9PEZI|nr:uncharacterized protein CLUP02_02635 [Colletotrichum lupini]UQC77168.1 hypothetical protein CLUP02_02635 [Colletotrichum lupini]